MLPRYCSNIVILAATNLEDVCVSNTCQWITSSLNCFIGMFYSGFFVFVNSVPVCSSVIDFFICLL